MDQGKEEKTKEAAQARGEAVAYTTVGVLGAAGWAAVEFMPAAEVAANVSASLMEAKNRSWQRIGIVVAAASIGALIYAAYKHMQANDIENKKDDSWVERMRRGEVDNNRAL